MSFGASPAPNHLGSDRIRYTGPENPFRWRRNLGKRNYLLPHPLRWRIDVDRGTDNKHLRARPEDILRPLQARSDSKQDRKKCWSTGRKPAAALDEVFPVESQVYLASRLNIT